MRNRLARGATWATLFSLITTLPGCGSKKSTPGNGSGSPLADKAYQLAADAPDGLDIRVSDGKAGPPAFDRAKLAPAKKLGDAEVNAMMTRAKPIEKDAADQQAFALRPRSNPPPRTGNTITGTFPPPPSSLLPPKANDAGKDLTVLRYMPEGQVPLAPELSVTFSQPMVAVTSQGDAAGVTPVKLTPTPKGNWRWIGTRTILFDPDVRFPQATTYSVEVRRRRPAARSRPRPSSRSRRHRRRWSRVCPTKINRSTSMCRCLSCSIRRSTPRPCSRRSRSPRMARRRRSG